MKGLLYKDFAVLLNSYKRNTLLIVGLYAVIVIASRQAYLAYALAVMGGIYASSTVSFDEQSHWDTYARTLPVTPGQIVGAKYLMCILSTAALGLVSGVLLLILLPLTAQLAGDAALPAAGESAVGILSCAVVSLLMAGVTLPFSYKYGGTKARTYMGVAFGAVCFVLFFAAEGLPPEMKASITAALDHMGGAALAAGLALAGAVLFGISYAACVKIYAHKDS